MKDGNRVVHVIWVPKSWCGLIAALLLSACSSLPPFSRDVPALRFEPDAWLPAPAILLGEQHEAPQQPDMQLHVVQSLVERGQLAALVLEMVEQGRDTRQLSQDASEKQVRTALAWRDQSWPWARYGKTVMAAVRAGVPVLGGNLPRSQISEVMRQGTLDGLLDAGALAQQRENIGRGHCGLLPPSQIPGMTRVQVARDQALAQTVMAAWQPGRTVVMVSGNEHARRDLGVPRHLARLGVPWPTEAGEVKVVLMQARSPEGRMEGEGAGAATGAAVWWTEAYPARDHCAELRHRWGRR